MTGLQTIYMTLDFFHRLELPPSHPSPPFMRDAWVERLISLQQSSKVKLVVEIFVPQLYYNKRDETYANEVRSFETQLKRRLGSGRESRDTVIEMGN